MSTKTATKATNTGTEVAPAVTSFTTPEDVASFLIAGKSPLLSSLLSQDKVSDADRDVLLSGVEHLGHRQGNAVAGIAVAVHTLSGRADGVTGAGLAKLANLSEGRISQLKLAGRFLAEIGCPNTITPASLCTAVSNGTKGSAIRKVLDAGGPVAGIRKAVAGIVNNGPAKPAPKAIAGSTDDPSSPVDETTESGMPSASGARGPQDPDVSLRESIRRLIESAKVCAEFADVLTESQRDAIDAAVHELNHALALAEVKLAETTPVPPAPKPGPAKK